MAWFWKEAFESYPPPARPDICLSHPWDWRENFLFRTILRFIQKHIHPKWCLCGKTVMLASRKLCTAIESRASLAHEKVHSFIFQIAWLMVCLWLATKEKARDENGTWQKYYISKPISKLSLRWTKCWPCLGVSSIQCVIINRENFRTHQKELFGSYNTHYFLSHIVWDGRYSQEHVKLWPLR